MIDIYVNDFFSIGSFIYYKTQAEMCYKWIQLLWNWVFIGIRNWVYLMLGI